MRLHTTLLIGISIFILFLFRLPSIIFWRSIMRYDRLGLGWMSYLYTSRSNQKWVFCITRLTIQWSMQGVSLTWSSLCALEQSVIDVLTNGMGTWSSYLCSLCMMTQQDFINLTPSEPSNHIFSISSYFKNNVVFPVPTLRGIQVVMAFLMMMFAGHWWLGTCNLLRIITTFNRRRDSVFCSLPKYHNV